MTWRLRLLLILGNLLVLALVAPGAYLAYHHEWFFWGAVYGALCIALGIRFHYGKWL